MTNKAHEMLGMPHSPDSSDGTTENRLSTRSASVSDNLRVIFRAVQLSFVFVAVSTFKLATALFTSEMLRMHTLSLQNNKFTINELLALGADFSLWTDALCAVFFACVTIDISLLFFECAADQVLTATSAIEVLWMILVFPNRDASIDDGKAAIVAPWTVKLVVIDVTVCVSFMLDKLSIGERLVAMMANEMLRMVSLPKSRDDTSDDHLITMGTWRTVVNDGSSIGHVSSQRPCTTRRVRTWAWTWTSTSWPARHSSAWTA